MTPDEEKCVNSALHLFKESDRPDTVVVAQLMMTIDGERVLDIPKPHFLRMYTKLLQGEWVTGEDWKKNVRYTMSKENESKPLYLSLDDEEAASCYRESLSAPPVMWNSTNELSVRLNTCLTYKEPPPEAGERFTVVQTCMFKEFTRFSSVVEGVTWVYRLSVIWEAGCVRDTYTSIPSHQIRLTLYKDPSVPGYIPAHDEGQVVSLARNMLGKAKYVLAPRGVSTHLHPEK